MRKGSRKEELRKERKKGRRRKRIVKEKETREGRARRQKEDKGLKEREEGKEQGKCEAKVFQGNESDEEKVDKDVTGEVEGMVKTPQIPWDSRQSEVRDELTDATNLELPWKFMRQSR